MKAYHHSRIRYKYLSKYSLSLKLYTKRTTHFKNQYKCREFVITVFENTPEIRLYDFCAKEKTGKHLCSNPIFPNYEGRKGLYLHINREDYFSINKDFVSFVERRSFLQKRMREHRQKMIEKQLPAAFSHYEEALFQG